MHSFLEKVYEGLFTLFTSTKRTLALNLFVIKWTENSKTLFAEIRSDGLKKYYHSGYVYHLFYLLPCTQERSQEGEKLGFIYAWAEY